MRCLCSLILTLLFSQSASANEFGISYSHSKNNNPLAIFSIKDKTTSSQDAITVHMINDFGHFRLRKAISFSPLDESKIILRDANQMPHQLGNIEIIIPTVSIEAGYAKDEDDISVSIESNIASNPLFSYGAGISYVHDFLDKTTLLFLDYSYSKSSSPVDYFINKDFKIYQRPTDLNTHFASVAVEQVLSETVRTRVKLSTARTLESRPQSVGLDITTAAATSEDTFLKVSFLQYLDLRNYQLLSERGYFSAHGGKLELTHELFYDFFVSASYSLVVEREHDPRDGKISQVAHDLFGLGTQFKLFGSTFFASAGYDLTNTPADSFFISGGFKCKF